MIRRPPRSTLFPYTSSSDLIARLVLAIRHLHGCAAVHRETVAVHEVFRGQTVWDGEVEAFDPTGHRSEEHTSELQSQSNIVCRLLLDKKKHRRIHIQDVIVD